MVAAVVERYYVPPKRWLVRLEPEPESPGALLRRLRGKTSLAHVAQQVLAKDVPDAEVLTLQTKLSRYERNQDADLGAKVIDALERLYGLSQGTIVTTAHRWELWRSQQKPLPGISFAIPDEPELIEAVNVLFRFEPEDLPSVAEVLRARADADAAAEAARAKEETA